MKKILFVSLISCLIISCGNNERIIEISDNYVEQNFVPLFKNSEFSSRKDENIHEFKNDALKKMEYLNILQEHLLDKKQIQVISSSENYKDQFLENEILSSSINAIEKADLELGFYIVQKSIKYGKQKSFTFDIVVSKDLQVLNTKIDTTKMYKGYQQTLRFK